MGQIEDIFASVDEELEQDRVHKYWKENQDWIIGGLVFFFVGLFAYVGWLEYRQNRDQGAALLYVNALEEMQAGRWSNADKEMRTLLAAHEGQGYGRLGHLLQARILMESGKREEALQSLEALARDEGAIVELRDAALINAALITLEQPDQVRAYLARLSPASPFRAQAKELEGLLAAAAGDGQAARERYQEALALQPGSGLRDRLDARLERLAPAPAGK